MQSMREELRETICRRVRTATQDELLCIVVALASDEVDHLEAAPAAKHYPAAPGKPPPAPARRRFALRHDDQVVVDTTTGLMWSRAELTEERQTWSDASKVCEELELAGYSDWRLPTIDELFALADRTRHDPAIDTEAFPGCKPNWYWTGTPYAPSPGCCAWVVYFYNGFADWGNRYYDGFVRAVRAGQ